MTSTTDPTVPLPTATDTDDDDDDDDLSSSLLPSQPPAATSAPAPPTIAPVPAPPPAETGVSNEPTASVTTSASVSASTSGNPSISQTLLPSSAIADSLPSGSPAALDPTTPTNGSTNGLSTGASVGIGTGVALIVCLAAFGTWYFLRRRKAQRTKTCSASSHSSDEEHAPQAQKSEVYAYRVDGPAEVPADEKPRRWSELESPTYVAEAGDGQVYRAELPGSAVPVAVGVKGADDRLFTDAPIDEVEEPTDPQERTIDKTDERLFSDPPIDEGTDTLASVPSWEPEEKKG